MKVVFAPVNISGQPITLVRELCAQGVDASLVQYVGKAQGHRFEYDKDRTIAFDGATRPDVQVDTIRELLADGVDVFHFWLRSLFYVAGVYEHFTGFDIPLLKHYGRKVVYRFTGEDLRLKSEHVARNPYNAYRYGYESKLDEAKQRQYLDFLGEYVDQFVVQDIEMQEFCPSARIVPRAIDLAAWAYVGPINKERPLVVHAPSSPEVKGSTFVRAAVEELENEGLTFDYREVVDLPHSEAGQVYRAADIVVDQLHIGWYGVLAMEAMALGKTVLGYVRDDLYRAHKPQIPLVVANPDNIRERLRMTIKDHELRAEYGLKARRFVEQVHDVRLVAAKLVDLYDNLYDRAAPPRSRYPALEYFHLQYSLMNSQLAEARRAARSFEALKKDLPSLRARARRFDELTTREIASVLMRRLPASLARRAARLLRSGGGPKGTS